MKCGHRRASDPHGEVNFEGTSYCSEWRMYSRKRECGAVRVGEKGEFSTGLGGFTELRMYGQIGVDGTIRFGRGLHVCSIV